ncbi:protein phosphatase 2C domain-containing protein [Candidatus Uhrbacteria bacterium]|nr:protein phosphatase 2C domain-containing protein [Candidatus Uhrbacteria bacterium]
MRNGVQQEQAKEVLESKEQYLELFEKEWAEIHEGSAPETGLKDAGRSERKKICEDVKLKNAEKGIFLVADGVSSQEGWFASRETARVMYELLGERLDTQIENNLQEALRNGEDPIERISQYVAAQMTSAVAQAHTRILAMGVRPEFQGSATTLSLTKLIDLPDGNGKTLQRMFFTNIGDSRIYIQRTGEQIEQLSRDDSRLQMRVESGRISAEDAKRIDQAESPGQLDPSLREFARGRNIITKSVGLGNPTEDLGVFFLDLKPGDKIVIVSDGVSDQLLESQIESGVSTTSGDEEAEARLQELSLEMSLEGTRPRAKGDDISALVYTAKDRGPSREYLRPAEQKRLSIHDLQAQIKRLQEVLPAMKDRVRVTEAKVQALRLDALTPKREKIAAMLELHRALKEEALYEYHLEKSRLDILDQQIPPRYEVGAQVHVWREDFAVPSLDRQMWTVMHYDPIGKAYTVRGAGGVQKELSRFQLESHQPGPLVRLGDELIVRNEIGALEQGFRVTAVDIDQSVVLVKEREGVLKRARKEGEDTQEELIGFLYQGELKKRRMDQANERYNHSKEEEMRLAQEGEMITVLESRQHAMNVVREKTLSVEHIRLEIVKMEGLLHEHQTLEEQKRFGGIGRDGEARRKKLALVVHGGRNIPSLSEQIQEKRKELEELMKEQSS